MIRKHLIHLKMHFELFNQKISLEEN